MLVAGEAGIGKSSLVAAAADLAASAGLAVAWGRSTEQLGAPPFGPWRQIAAALGDANQLDLVAADDPVGERFARFESFRAWLHERTSHTGALIALDDAHVADEATLRLLVDVATTVEQTSVLLVVTYRDPAGEQAPGFDTMRDQLSRLPGTARVDLRGFRDEAIDALVAGRAPVAEVVAATGGNPLFVTELVRHLEAGGSIGERAGHRPWCGPRPP